MKISKTSALSKMVFYTFRFFAKIKYRKIKIIGLENLPQQNIVFVANHAQLNGPIIAQLHMPENCYIWANGQMFASREVPDYAMEDFFPFKAKLLRPLFRLVSYILAPLMPCIMKNARTIPVYHDARIVSTFRTTVSMLSEGRNILIFPECHEKNNNIVNRFRENFVDLARLYYRRSGVAVRFVPMYITPDFERCYFGKGMDYNPTVDMAEERHRIAEGLSKEITQLARALPEHTVVPFDNIPRRRYLSNKAVDFIPE